VIAGGGVMTVGADEGWASAEVALPSGGTLRASRRLGDGGDRLVLALGGSSARASTPRWSPYVAWLVERLAEDDPSAIYLEVRYRDRRWSALDSCIRDARAALGALPASAAVTLLGFSMGGGVAIAVADDERVTGVVGLAPWVPDSVQLSGLAGKRLAIVHGTNDRYLPFLPGVPPSHSRLVRERAEAAGARTSYETISGARHLVAIRTPLGLLPLPHAREWLVATARAVREIGGGAGAA
jgi:predicted esterase